MAEEMSITLTEEEYDYLWSLLDKDANELRHAKTAIFNEAYYELHYGSKLKLNNNIRVLLAGLCILKDTAAKGPIYPTQVGHYVYPNDFMHETRDSTDGS